MCRREGGGERESENDEINQVRNIVKEETEKRTRVRNRKEKQIL